MRPSRFVSSVRESTSISARVAELVDAADSKSAAREGVPVQVRPLVPLLACAAQTDISRFFCACG